MKNLIRVIGLPFLIWMLCPVLTWAHEPPQVPKIIMGDFDGDGKFDAQDLKDFQVYLEQHSPRPLCPGAANIDRSFDPETGYHTLTKTDLSLLRNQLEAPMPWPYEAVHCEFAMIRAGDVNLDGRTDITDVYWLGRVANKAVSADELECPAAANLDGNVDENFHHIIDLKDLEWLTGWLYGGSAKYPPFWDPEKCHHTRLIPIPPVGV